MHKKLIQRPAFWVVTVLILLLLSVVVLVIVNFPKPLSISNSSYDLSALANGNYEGECSNGLVYAKVVVTIQDHQLQHVKILEHRNGKGQAAESIPNTVVAEQSLSVDAVSGATVSSQTILKAIENALSVERKN